MSGGQWCLGMSVRGTAVPRHECPGGHFVGVDNHAYDTYSFDQTVFLTVSVT